MSSCFGRQLVYTNYSKYGWDKLTAQRHEQYSKRGQIPREGDMFFKNPKLFIVRFVLTLSLLGGAFGVTAVRAEPIVYRVTSTGVSDPACGSSWSNPCDLQYTLTTLASAGDELWVAAGTYKPTTGTDRALSFILKDGVAIYGGFSGTELLRAQRDPATNITTLSGDIGVTGDHGDNSYHVVVGSNTTNIAVLDGFTVTAGHANLNQLDKGGGMLNYRGSPTVTNVTFSDNSAGLGGGMYNGGDIGSSNGSHPVLTNVSFQDNSALEGGGMENQYSSSPSLTNVIFSNNSAIRSGGGVINFGNSNPTLTNVTFSSNTASIGGGMMNWDHSNPILTNVTFHANSATDMGGGMDNEASNPSLKNVTMSGNQASQGGGMNNGYPSIVSITNSILYGNSGGEIYGISGVANVTYSIVQGGYTGTGNLDVNPLLGPVQDNGGFTQTMALLPGSPAIDAGDNVNCPVADQRGLSRPQGSGCDIGAFELYNGAMSAGETVRVSTDAIGMQADTSSSDPALSADGQFVVFGSSATNLVAGDTNAMPDVFVRDLQTGITTRASVDSNGAQANGGSSHPFVSADGRYVLFESDATNLVPDDTNGKTDVFIHDRQSGVTARLSVAASGEQANDTSFAAALSADGNYSAFSSKASNLVPDDTNGTYDIFVRDLQTGTVTRVSVDSNGGQANGTSFYPSLSGDGRYITFESDAMDLVPGDTNGITDVFVRDVQAGTTTRVSVSSSGTQGDKYSANSSISTDGRYVVFHAIATTLVPGDTNGATDVFVHDLQMGTTTRVSVDSDGAQGNGGSQNPAISEDGRYIVFDSCANNLIPDDDGLCDVFVHDMQSGATARVSVDSSGVQANGFSSHPSVSADGQYIAFDSNATNLVSGDTNDQADIFVHRQGVFPIPPTSTPTFTPTITDTPTSTPTNTPTPTQTPVILPGETIRVSVDSSGGQGNGYSYRSSLSGDGRYIAFVSYTTNLVPGDTNGVEDVFLHDTQTGVTRRVSVDSNGAQANNSSSGPSISANGRYVAFGSSATNFGSPCNGTVYDIFLHDIQTGTTTCVSVDSNGVPGNEQSNNPSISADGRYIAFDSYATNLVPGDTNPSGDIFVHDMQTGMTTLVSVDSNGVQGNNGSGNPATSADGRYVVFDSYATNLVPGDTNQKQDIFMHDVQTGVTRRISTNSTGAQANGTSVYPSVSADGRYVVFESDASDLVSGDTNAQRDLFLHDIQTGTTRRVSVDSNGMQGNNMSNNSSISADGRYVLFESKASNLVAGDTNAVIDVFVHDLQTEVTTRVSVNSSGEQAIAQPCFMCYAFKVGISADGQYVTFTSDATNLVANDTNSAPDIFVHRQAILPIPPTDTPTFTPTVTDTPTSTPTFTPTFTPTITMTPTITPSNTPTSTPTNTATYTPTITNTPSPTFTPTNTFTPTATPSYSYHPLYLSLTNSQTIGGVASADEDILHFDGQNWSLFFDGSDVGVGTPDLFAFSLLDADTILMSFSANVTVNGITATPQDVLRFDATSLGSTTAGTFSLYFDGSDVGLSATAENIDAFSLLHDGSLLLSTTGNPSVPGLTTGRDEDVLAFTPTSLGSVTSGTWSLYFDGSDVGLAETNDEDLDALDVVGENLYLSTLGGFSVSGLSGVDEDVFVCAATSVGDVTACEYSPVLYFDGSTWGLTGNDVDALHFLAPPHIVPTDPAITLVP
jgi:Tol biopolymer transport system component